VLHLFLRGYWVALVGLHSVYPDGIRWERLKLGPRYDEASRAAVGGIPDRIEIADNRATRVFAVGFGLAMAMLIPIAVVALLLAVTYCAEWLDMDVRIAQAIFWIVLGLQFAPLLLAVAIDRHLGARFVADRPAARWLRRLFGFYLRLGFGRAGNPLLAVYTSQLGRARAALVMTGLMVPGMLLAVASLIGSRVDLAGVSFPGLPSARSESASRLDPARYDSLRGDASLDLQPYIADPVASGPYLRLFVPYQPRRHNAALRRSCPDALAAVRGGDAEPALACLARLHALQIDGKTLDVAFLASSDPRTHQRGMLAMIPVAGLAEGRHDLVLRAAPRTDATPAPLVHIPFWK
jgi:hypothetical protein